MRTQVGFVPATDLEAEKCRKVRIGSTVRANVSQMRNPQFFRKWWALVSLAFDLWSETVDQQEYKGIKVEPDLERFRKDLTILAGLYRPVFNVKGECRLEAESISFANMTEERFEELFSKTIDVILKSILPNSGLSEKDLRTMADEVVRFG